MGYFAKTLSQHHKGANNDRRDSQNVFDRLDRDAKNDATKAEIAAESQNDPVETDVNRE